MGAAFGKLVCTSAETLQTECAAHDCELGLFATSFDEYHGIDMSKLASWEAVAHEAVDCPSETTRDTPGIEARATTEVFSLFVGTLRMHVTNVWERVVHAKYSKV